MIRYELVRRGYEVLQPLGTNQRYDLVVDDSGRFLRIQCKTGRLRNGAVVFSAVSVRANTKDVRVRGYQGEVEYFAVFCPDTDDVYLVPIADVPAREGSLRVKATRNAQQQGIRWAHEYRLPDVDSGASPE